MVIGTYDCHCTWFSIEVRWFFLQFSSTFIYAHCVISGISVARRSSGSEQLRFAVGAHYNPIMEIPRGSHRKIPWPPLPGLQPLAVPRGPSWPHWQPNLAVPPIFGNAMWWSRKIKNCEAHFPGEKMDSFLLVCAKFRHASPVLHSGFAFFCCFWPSDHRWQPVGDGQDMLGWHVPRIDCIVLFLSCFPYWRR